MIVKDNIASRIAEIRAENAAKCEMSKEEYRRYLIGAMRTPAADIGPASSILPSLRRETASPSS